MQESIFYWSYDKIFRSARHRAAEKGYNIYMEHEIIHKIFLNKYKSLKQKSVWQQKMWEKQQ